MSIVRPGRGEGEGAIVTREAIGGSWTNNNAWGTSVRVPFPPRRRAIQLGQALPVVSLTGILDASDAIVYARIRFGAGGSSSEVLCDWKHGTVIRPVASWIAVDAVTAPTLIDYPPAPSYQDPPLEFHGSVFVSDRDDAGNATYTVSASAGYTAPSGYVNTVFFAVPSYARRVALYSDRIDAADPTKIVYSFLANSGAVLGDFNQVNVLSRLGEFYAVPGNCACIQVVDELEDGLSVTAVWELDL